MSKEFFGNLRLLSSLTIVLPLLIGMWKYYRLSKMQRKLFYLVILFSITELIANILWYQKLNNLPVYHFYTIIEFLCIIYIYKDALYKIFPKYVFTIAAVLFTLFCLINMCFFQSILTFNSNATTILGLLVIFLTTCYFYALLKEVKYTSLERNPMFWLNAGFLIYFSSNLLLFFISNSLSTETAEVNFLVWGLHAIVNIVLVIFFIIAIWVNPDQQ
ncbi:hypothetical protein [uncultured Kordia sp.]|uniref:hypothetical protein n=1 Tax=uncultured Kordia sp. TaxID=507699 RepID=UPI0026197630|nr:hypothetical protein [uncultured Kordia sp.]